jgi:hypothetical protein
VARAGAVLADPPWASPQTVPSLRCDNVERPARRASDNDDVTDGGPQVATVAQCEQALHKLAERLAAADTANSKIDFDRWMTCTIRDLDLVFAGHLTGNRLVDIVEGDARDAQVRLTMDSDDLIALVDGDLKIASAWATGRVKIDAGVRDLMRLRSIL